MLSKNALTQKEIRKLKGIYQSEIGSITISLLVAIFSLGIGTIMKKGDLFYYFFGIMLFGFSILSYIGIQKVSEDLKEKLSNSVKGKILTKNILKVGWSEKISGFEITIQGNDGQKYIFQIGEKPFNNLLVNDDIEISFAPNSKEIFLIETNRSTS